MYRANFYPFLSSFHLLFTIDHSPSQGRRVLKLKIFLCIVSAVLLQSALGAVWLPLRYIDLPLIAVVYFALQRDAVQAVITGCLAGLATDALSGGSLLGASGFTKTLVAYSIAYLTSHIVLNNPLARIPVLAGAAAIDSAVYVLLHRLFRQTFFVPVAETAAYKLIATTVVGTIIFYVLDAYVGEHADRRRQFAFRRRIARRRTGRRRT